MSLGENLVRLQEHLGIRDLGPQGYSSNLQTASFVSLFAAAKTNRHHNQFDNGNMPFYPQ